jgi:glycosyltransferase involved in cell wall biosynthesis
MKILHLFNRHRGGGGADNAWDATIALSRSRGLDVATFERDSRTLPQGLRGKFSAFANGLYGADAVRAFAARLQEGRPDIVHTHELYPLITPWVLEICARAGVPVVHSCYDFRITCPIATHFDGTSVCTRCSDKGAHHAVLRDCRGNRMESAAFALRHAVAKRRDFYRRHVAQFIVLTDFSRRWLIEHAGVAPERITVNECAVPAAPVPVDPAKGSYFAYAGRLVPEKGIATLIDAARVSGLPVRIAVPAGTDTSLINDPAVSVVPTSGPEMLAEFYRGARALIVPSLWFETFSIVAAEAMGHGVPVIAARIGALRDTVRENQTGLHFTPGNAAELAALMARLWSDSALCRGLGAAAHADVQARFGEDLHFQRLLNAYRRGLAIEASVGGYTS